MRELTGSRQSGKDVKQIIAKLNPVLRGWGNYFRTGNADREFNKMDGFVVKSLRRWQYRRGGQRPRRLRAKGTRPRWSMRLAGVLAPTKWLNMAITTSNSIKVNAVAERCLAGVTADHVPGHTELRRPKLQVGIEALRDQLGLTVLDLKPVGLAGSGGSTPLRIRVAGDPDTYVFGKLYAMNHVRADRWYKLGRTILYGRLEDERPFQSVRRLVQYEDYALRVMRAIGASGQKPEGWFFPDTYFFRFGECKRCRKINIIDTGNEKYKCTEDQQHAQVSGAYSIARV